MDKEEIEKDDKKHIIKVLTEHKDYIFEFDDDNIKIEHILDYIKYLEQKGSILDKVTDKLKEIDTKYTNEYKNIEKLELIEGNTAVLQELSCVLDDIYEILNIAKGEKK